MLKFNRKLFVVYFGLCFPIGNFNQCHHELILEQLDWLILRTDGTFPDLGFGIALKICLHVKALIVVAPLAFGWSFHGAHCDFTSELDDYQFCSNLKIILLPLLVPLLNLFESRLKPYSWLEPIDKKHYVIDRKGFAEKHPRNVPKVLVTVVLLPMH